MANEQQSQSLTQSEKYKPVLFVRVVRIINQAGSFIQKHRFGLLE
jgi:hypothetical protein